MGYTTDFSGSFSLNKPLTKAQAAYLAKFSDTRRMQRDASLTAKRPDPIREAVGLPVGVEGEFFVGAEGDFGQEGFGPDAAKDVINHNVPASTQPGLWCQWVPTKDGKGIEWNGAEKFYHYVEWLQYIITNFLKPWGLVLNGEVEYQGEDAGDKGEIYVNDNVVTKN